MFSLKVIRVKGLLIAFLFLFGLGSCKSLITEGNVESVTQNNTVNIPNDGYIRLVLNDNTGGFLLYYLSDPQTMRYEPLFNANDPMASFLSVYVDGKVYRPDSSRQFNTRIDRYKGDPAYIIESPFVRVIEVFTPVKTSGSKTANGVMITIIVRNTAAQRASVGVRMLLDTNLGEGRKKVPFLTNLQVVSSETLLEGNSGESFWVTRGEKTALMGSIVSPVDGLGKGPDFVHIANWKRLNDVSWMLPYSQGRSFNNLPHSVDDSAVCYYFGPEMIDPDKIITYTIFLTTEDLAWYNLSVTPPHMKTSTETAVQPVEQEPVKQTPVPAPVYKRESAIDIPAIEAQAQVEAAAKNENADTITLIKLQEILNQFIDGQIVLNELDLRDIEEAIERHRN